jgi:hypothetical protein
VSLYLDASVLVALFVIDPSSARAEAFLSAHPEIAVVSDFGVAEFSSAVGRRVRIRDLTREDGQLALKGEGIVITRRGQPVVELKPVRPVPRPIALGGRGRGPRSGRVRWALSTLGTPHLTPALSAGSSPRRQYECSWSEDSYRMAIRLAQTLIEDVVKALPLDGEGWEGVTPQVFGDRRTHAFEVRQHLVVPEA